MPVLIAAAVIVLLLLWRLWGRDRAQGEISSRLDPVWYRIFSRKRCRWQRRGGSGALTQFQCETCGVTAYSKTPKGPKECKRGLTGGL